MLLRIETFKSAAGGDHVAVAAAEDELLSSGACASATSERGAIVEAINTYFRKGTELVLEEPASFNLRRRASTPAQLRMLIDELTDSEDGRRCLLHYEDSRGNITTREVAVSKREASRAGYGFPEDYLIAVDTEKDEPRSFRLDRIHWMETIA